jgi:glycosyltransferase involved in cell wall biosynthesis
MSSRIIFVSLVYHPDLSAASLLFTDLFTRLADAGLECTVLTGFPSKDGADATTSAPRSEVVNGVRVRRCGLRLRGKRNVLSRALTYSSFLAHAGWTLLLNADGALTVVGTDPPFTSIAVWGLAAVGRFRYDCLLLDVYPDGLVALGSLHAGSVLTRIWRHLNGVSFRHARRVVVIGRDMAELLRTGYSVDASLLAYVPLWAPRELDVCAVRASGHDLRKELGLSDRFALVYSGNMGLWHDMHTIIRAADCLRTDERVVFVFIGGGRRRESAEHLSRRLRLPNTVWLDLMPREQVAHALAGCDAGLVSMRAGLEGIAVPSKLYGILAAGRAVLAQVPSGCEIARVVEEEACGIVTAPGDVAALADAIRRLAADPQLAREMGRRARAAYEAKYTLDRAVAEFTSIWQDP